MPNIREYANPIDGLQPTDRGVQSSVELGRHVERAYAVAGNALGNAVTQTGAAYDKIKTQQDISQGLAQKAQILDNLTTASDVAMNQDPNDHTAAEKWRTEQMEPLLDSWVSGFSTQESRLWATEQAGQIRQHLYEKTAADQSRNAGVAAVQNFNDTLKGLSNTVLQDPSARDMALRSLDDGTEALIKTNPFITPQQAEQMRGEMREQGRTMIGESAFKGSALTNPTAAMQDLQDGKYNGVLNAEQQVRMFGFARQIHREALADQRSQMAMSKEQAKTQFDQQLSSTYATMFRPDGSTVLPPGGNTRLVQLSQMPFADPGAIKSLGDAMKTAAEAKINGTFQTTNNGVWSNLAGRIGQPVSSPNALTHAMVDQAYAAHQLSEHDWRFLHQAVETAKNDPATTAAMTQINQALERNKPLVTKSNLYSGVMDQGGDVQYDALHFDTFKRFQDLQQSGMSAKQAADVLVDPRNPQGIHSMLPGYMSNNKQGLQALHLKVQQGGGAALAAPAPLTSPRQPGESAADYLKRTGG